MKYLLDTNSLSNDLIRRAIQRRDVVVLKEVEEERTMFGSVPSGLREVTILHPEAKHLRRLQELLVQEGDNFDLIRLFTGEGTADVMMLAYVLAEREQPETLFPEEYTIVTRDRGLTETAARYDIACQAAL